jgi:chemotaxis protein methyltransferase CheR
MTTTTQRDQVATAPRRSQGSAKVIAAPAFTQLRTLVKQVTGIELEPRREAVIKRRLGKRAAEIGLTGPDDYLGYLLSSAHGPELQFLVNAVTINKTSFFREAHHFAHLRDAIPDLLHTRTAEKVPRIRIWSAGCSTGQEAYSIAMTLLETVPENKIGDTRILASDVDTAVLHKAETGIYGREELCGLDETRRHTFFKPLPGQPDVFGTTSPLAKLVEIRHLNLHNSWPMTLHFDAIFCRNVLIYFGELDRQILVQRFCHMLAPGGYLYLGHSEGQVNRPKALVPCGTTVFRKF